MKVHVYVLKFSYFSSTGPIAITSWPIRFRLYFLKRQMIKIADQGLRSFKTIRGSAIKVNQFWNFKICRFSLLASFANRKDFLTLYVRCKLISSKPATRNPIVGWVFSITTCLWGQELLRFLNKREFSVSSKHWQATSCLWWGFRKS